MPENQQAGYARPSGRSSLPGGLRGAAAWSAAALLIGAVVYVVVQFAVTVGALVLTLLVGLLLTALLQPVAALLERVLPRLAAAWLVIIAAIATLAGVGVFIEQQLVAQIPVLSENLAGGLRRLRDLLVEQLGIAPRQLDQVVDAAVQKLLSVAGSGTATAGPGSAIVTGTTLALGLLAALALALFTAFWLVYDGARVWSFLLGLFPERWRDDAARAGVQAWSTLGGYLRGVTLVALIDGVGVGLALLLLGVPLPFTLALITFLGGYIPLVGATAAGMVAVLVALASQGPTTALLTLGAVVLVQQVEGQLLQPLIMGRTLQLHPLAIAYAITLGGLLWGIAGAVISVPLTAALYAVASSLARDRPRRAAGLVAVEPGRSA